MNRLLEQNGLAYADSQEAIKDLICGLIDESHHEFFVERRRNYRHSLAILLSVAPIENGQLGSEFPAVTHDISSRGISFLYDSPVDCKYLFVRFPEYNRRQALVVEVLRQTKIRPFTMIAGMFRPTF